MPKATRYEPNHVEFAKLMRSAQILEPMIDAGYDVVDAAKGFSPTSDQSEKGSGDGTHYVDHFDVHATEVTINGSPRAAVDVTNDSKYSAQVEWGDGSDRRPQGGSHGSGHRPLGRAGAVVGEYHGAPLT